MPDIGEGVVEGEPDSPEYPYAKIFVDTPKIVFSKTVKTMEGKNVTVENGDLVQAINQLKTQSGKDMIVYGGANFVSELIKNKLIDELNFLVNPIAIGKGLPIFNERNPLTLVRSVYFANGVLLNTYIL